MALAAGPEHTSRPGHVTAREASGAPRPPVYNLGAEPRSVTPGLSAFTRSFPFVQAGHLLNKLNSQHV
ncbi:hypothetical protein V5799_030012 [Amblyomma americanum]|uniref:Uncharacterized protein n=1 Tax=Amblyomma americanum TaxID=6943 RepID=A0AAQ4EPI3_AMBAM